MEKLQLECIDAETIANAFEQAEASLNALDDPEKGLFHVFFDGESRTVEGKMEVKLDDGSFYPL